MLLPMEPKLGKPRPCILVSDYGQLINDSRYHYGQMRLFHSEGLEIKQNVVVQNSLKMKKKEGDRKCKAYEFMAY